MLTANVGQIRDAMRDAFTDDDIIRLVSVTGRVTTHERFDVMEEIVEMDRKSISYLSIGRSMRTSQ